MKICSMCKQEKSEDDFSKKTVKKNGEIVFQWHCKTCHSGYRKLHYQNNRSKYIGLAQTRNKKHKIKMYTFLIEYFKEHPCVDCGETDPLVLEFDHVRGEKTTEISDLMYHKFQTLLDEIDKCEVRCANCHRKITAIRGKWLMAELLDRIG